ncbi:MAG: alpha/beta fold hydrolase [Alphaproteobacteria bacterium]|nr:alpha/beta fold hydrolase [Alphaproteobacteria bacterium]
MTKYRKPDQTVRVKVPGGRVVVDSFGAGDEVLLCLHGGPGCTIDYVRDSHSVLADHGYRVVAFDQLGSGRSDKPKDTSLWAIPRFVAEVEAVRAALGLGRVHLLGQSWGTWLGIEYCLKHLGNVKTFILANGSGSVPQTVAEMNRLRASLGAETVAMMLRHEAEGTTEHPEYLAAVTILYHRHVCRADPWPEAVRRSMDGINPDVYGTMWGPNEFRCVGTLKDWDRLADMRRITVPALIINGMHDELTPACAMAMHQAMPRAEVRIFKNSAHMPFWEEPDAYFGVLRAFLDRHRAAGKRPGRSTRPRG